ncbi:MAG: hypothetical protein QOH73_993 [Gaiellaceae bacterium]|nr:hypothetical protein [Gaiellaceae bacterium]
MELEIRPCTLEEYTDGLKPIWQFFGHVPDEDTLARFTPLLPPERLLAAWTNGVAVGGAGSFPFRLSVPGGELDVGGVTVVGVSPTHRRRGVLSAMMRRLLNDTHERGEAVAALFASEGGIYGRFGFGLAALMGEISLPRVHGALRGDPVPGAEVRFVTVDEARTLFPPIHEAVRKQRPGMPSRSEDWWRLRILDDPLWSRDGGGIKMYVVAELEGRPAGYAMYRHHQHFEHGSSIGRVQVVEAMGDEPAATDALWRYLVGIDWVQHVTCDLLPVDHELQLKLVENRRMGFTIGDGLWIRIVDLAPALSARSYAGDGEVVLQVQDGLCSWNDGRWRVSGGGCERTDAAADISLPVDALGSVYLGGFTFADLIRARLAEELRPGAVARADALFATSVKPWCPEIF